MWDESLQDSITSTICAHLSEKELENVSQLNKKSRNWLSQPTFIIDLLFYKKFDLVKWLENRKFIDSAKFTPDHLFSVAISGNPEVIDWLCSHGLNFKDLQDNRPFLLLNFYANDLEILQWFINQGTNVNAYDKGELLLYRFLKVGNFEAAKVLIKNGANIYLENSDGISPYCLIKENRGLIKFTSDCIHAKKNNSKRPDVTSTKKPNQTSPKNPGTTIISFRFSGKGQTKRVYGKRNTGNLRDFLLRRQLNLDSDKNLRLEFAKQMILDSNFVDFKSWQQGLLSLAELKISWARDLHSQGSHVLLYTSVDLSYPGDEGKLGIEGSRMISKILSNNANLTTLNLSGHSIEDTGVAYIMNALSTAPFLKILDLSNNKIGIAGAHSISHTLTDHMHLKELNLEWNNIGNAGMASIGNSLLVNKSLQKLNVSLNYIKDEGVEPFGKVLTANSTLQELNLSNNEIGNKGVKMISCGLKNNSSLEVLYLSNNSITCEEATAMGDSLLVNKFLRTLHLSNNLIQDEGMKAFGDALAINIALQELDLSENAIENEGLGFLKKGIIGNSTLRYLDLLFNGYWEDEELSDFKNLCKNKDIVLKIEDNEYGNEDEYDTEEEEDM